MIPIPAAGAALAALRGLLPRLGGRRLVLAGVALVSAIVVVLAAWAAITGLASLVSAARDASWQREIAKANAAIHAKEAERNRLAAEAAARERAALEDQAEQRRRIAELEAEIGRLDGIDGDPVILPASAVKELRK